MRNKIIMDIIFYLGIPLLTWNLLRDDLGDYYTILFGMVPAVIYTVVTFIRNREWNVTGIFFLSLITLNFLMNLLSHTAEQELWNGVWMGYLSIAFYSLTLVIRRPIGMYFFIDYAYAKGVPRRQSTDLYRMPEHFHHFIKFTLFLMLREVIVIVVKSIMINKMGVDGFNSIQITTSVLNYIFTGVTVVYVIYIIKQTSKNKVHDQQQGS